MAFINKIIGPDEKLIGIARLHWIYGLKGLFWLGGLILLGGAIDFFLATPLEGGLSPIGNAAFWICTVIGACLFVFYYLMLLFTELGLTTQRFIYKRGFIFVDVREIDLEEIKSANVDNGLLGRILNYGYIELDARFISDTLLPAVAEPYRFIKAMNEVRSKIKEDGMRVILDNPGSRAEQAAQEMQGNNESSPEEQNEPEHHLEDSRYDTFSDSPAENADDFVADVKESVKADNHKPHDKKKEPRKIERKTPEIFTAPKSDKAQKDGEAEKPEKSDHPELFVHKEALHDSVIDDFEEAEEGGDTSEDKAAQH